MFDLVKYEDWIKKFNSNLVSTIVVFIFIILTPIACNKVMLKSNPLDEAIEEYEKTGKRIYPYGRDCLEREGLKRGLETKDQYILLIKENEKWL